MDDDLVKFEEVFIQNHKSLCSLAYNLVGDIEEARDIVQEIFLKLWNRRHLVTMESAIGNYLKQATIHASYNHLNQRKLRLRILTDIGKSTGQESYERVESIGYQELETRARQAIDRLPPKCRTIFLLSRQQGMKYNEIAEQLNISPKTVENQMGIALEKLRSELKPFLKDFILPVISLLLLYFILKIFQ